MLTRCGNLSVLAAVTAVLLFSPSLASQTATPPDEAGWKALQSGNADQAAVFFQEALRRSPRDAVSLFGAGAAAHLLGRDDDAITSLTTSLTLNAKLTGASELLGFLQHQQGNIDEAVATYERALALGPTTPNVAAMRSRLDAWKKEASVHAGLAERNDARFSITFDGRSDQALASRASAVLDRAYWTIGERLGAYPPGRILVTL